MKDQPTGTPTAIARGRRTLLTTTTNAAIGLLAAIAVSSGASADESAGDHITVYKTPSCACCTRWIEHLRTNGLDVDVETVQSTRPAQLRLGVPEVVRSCHTAQVGRYWVEGHVPADLVSRLLHEQPPRIARLAVPGMPVGSPGMEGANPERYAVVQVGADGATSVLEFRDGRSQEE